MGRGCKEVAEILEREMREGHCMHDRVPETTRSNITAQNNQDGRHGNDSEN